MRIRVVRIQGFCLRFYSPVSFPVGWLRALRGFFFFSSGIDPLPLLPHNTTPISKFAARGRCNQHEETAPSSFLVKLVACWSHQQPSPLLHVVVIASSGCVRYGPHIAVEAWAQPIRYSYSHSVRGRPVRKPRVTYSFLRQHPGRRSNIYLVERSFS